MTTTEPTPRTGRAAGPSADEPARTLPIWGHLLLLLVFLTGVVLLTNPGGTMVADDGSYELQLRALDAGSWNYRAGTEQLDPDGTHYPIVNAEQTGDGWAPSAKHPAWPWLASKVAAITGVSRAFDVLGVLGVLGLATAAWLLAAEHERRWSRWAFWLAGTAPVALAAAVPWAHAAGAALAGFAVLGAVRLVHRRPSVGSAALLVGGAAGAVLLRTEGLLLVGAIGIALVVGGLQAGWSRGRSLLAGGGTVALGLAVVKAEGWWIESITGGASTTLSTRSGSAVTTSGFVDARYEGAVRSLIDSARPSMTLALGLVVIISALTAGLAASGRPGMVRVWQAAAAASAFLLVMRVFWLSNYPVSGVLAAWPIAVAGLAAAIPPAWARVRMEVVIVVAYAAAVGATQYPDGGGGSWGGRFFALATVPLAVLIALGLERLRAADPGPDTSLFAVRRFLVVLLIVPVLAGLGAVHDVHARTASLYGWIDGQVEGVAITETELPRMMWRSDIPWLVVDDGDGGDDLAGVLGSLAADGEPTASLVVLTEDLPEVGAALDGQTEWREVRREAREEVTVVVLGR